MLNGVLWKAKNGNIYFQAFALETEWNCGDAWYELSSGAIKLFNALEIDKEVEWVIGDGGYGDEYMYVKNGKNSNDRAEAEEIVNKYKCDIDRIVSADISTNVEYEHFGTCELCESEGTWTYYTGQGEKKIIEWGEE